MLRAALIVNLLIFVLYSQSDVEVNNFQTKILVDEKVLGFDVPVGDTVFVKVRKALDKARADLVDLVRKL